MYAENTKGSYNPPKGNADDKPVDMTELFNILSPPSFKSNLMSKAHPLVEGIVMTTDNWAASARKVIKANERIKRKDEANKVPDTSSVWGEANKSTYIKNGE